MDHTISLGNFQASFMGDNTITRSHNDIFKVEVKNDLSIAITNSSRIDTIELAYDSSKAVPSILDRSPHTDQPRIYLYFPAGDKEYNLTSINYVKQIECSTSRGWKVLEFDNDINFQYGRYWVVIPDTSADKINQNIRPGESAIIRFDSIITYRMKEGMSCLCIDARDIGNEKSTVGYMPIYIERSEPKVRRFTCSQNKVGILDKITFEWEVLGNVGQTYFYPGYGDNGAINISAKAENECVVMEDTHYTIRVNGEKDMVYGYCPVTVDEPFFQAFRTLDGKTLYKYGETITLYMRLENTNHCYLNAGIGRIDMIPVWHEGYMIIEGKKEVVCNAKFQTYEISCLGKQGLISTSIDIQCTDFLDIVNIVYQRNNSHYTLHWVVENAINLEIRTSDNVERTGSTPNNPILSGTAEFDGVFSKEPLSIRIKAEGCSNQKIDEIRKIN